MNNQRYIIKENSQGSEEWLKDRLGHFTGSDAAAVANNGAGLSTLIWEKVAEVITGKSKENFQTDAMIRGKEIESLGRSAVEIELGNAIKEVGFIELDKYTGASIDGFINDDSIFELKCPTDPVYVRFLYEGKIKPEYMWQVQHYLYVTDRKYCNFAIFNPNFPKPLVITKVERDEEAIKKLITGLATGVTQMKQILEKI